MNAIEKLEYVRKLDELINAKIGERDRIIAIATNISPSPMDGMPFSNTCTVSRKIENAVVKLIMLEQDLDRIIDEYVKCKQEVVRMLEKLPAMEYGVLHRYYVLHMSWEEVADDLGYSSTQIWRFKTRGLKHVIECNE